MQAEQTRADEQGYNGWKNYETWAVGMFLDGNYTGEGTYRDVLDLVAGLAEDADAEARSVVYAAETAIEHYVRDEVESEGASLAADLLGAALSSVDWRELAEHKVEEYKEVQQS